MIDKEILDAVLPLPTLDELKEQKVEELKDEGFVISNFHSGGVFYTMLMIVLRIKVEVFELLRVVLNNMFVSHAPPAWETNILFSTTRSNSKTSTLMRGTIMSIV